MERNGGKVHYDNTNVHLLLLVMSCTIVEGTIFSIIVREKGKTARTKFLLNSGRT